MIWPFHREQQKRIAAAEIAVAEARTRRYQQLFEIDTRSLDDMVARSLTLLKPEPKNDRSDS